MDFMFVCGLCGVGDVGCGKLRTDRVIIALPSTLSIVTDAGVSCGGILMVGYWMLDDVDSAESVFCV